MFLSLIFTKNLKTLTILSDLCILSDLLNATSIFYLIIVKKYSQMKYLLLLFSITFQGQVLHHQMISSQGASTKTANGLMIKQTIGQQSLTGTSGNKNYVVMQGFQQSLWGKYIASNNVETIEGIKTTTYPNPFTATINFQFSKPVTDMVSISIFDILGRLIFEQKKKAINTILTIDLTSLPTSEYLVRLNSTNLNYYTKIIKQ